MVNPLRQPTPGATFLPEDYVRAQGERRATIMAVMLFMVVMAAIVTAFVTTTQRWTSVRERQEQVQTAYESQARELKRLEELERQRLELADKGAITTALVERVPRSLLLAELVSSMPAQISLSTVDMSGERVKEKAAAQDAKDKGVKSISSKGSGKKKAKGDQPAAPKVVAPRFAFTVAIEGVSTTNEAITDYMSRLKGSPLLAAIELEFIEQVAVEGRDLRKFRIVGDLMQDLDDASLALVRERCGLPEVHASVPEPELSGDDSPEQE